METGVVDHTGVRRVPVHIDRSIYKMTNTGMPISERLHVRIIHNFFQTTILSLPMWLSVLLSGT